MPIRIHHLTCAFIFIGLVFSNGQAQIHVNLRPRPDIERTLALPTEAEVGIQRAIDTANTPLSFDGTMASSNAMGGPRMGDPFLVTVNPQPDIEHTLMLPAAATDGIQRAIDTGHTPLAFDGSATSSSAMGPKMGDPISVTINPRPDIEHTLMLPAAATDGIQQAIDTGRTPLLLLDGSMGTFNGMGGPPMAVPITVTVNPRPDIEHTLMLPAAAVGGLENAIQTGNTPLKIVNSGVQGGNVTITAGRYVNAGRLAPGNSPGTITIDGDFAQLATGVLDIEIGGTEPGTEYDTLHVTGGATLSGTLAVSLIDEFVPNIGDEFVFFSADGAISGSFDLQKFEGLPKGLGFDLLQDEHSMWLVAKSVNNPEPASIAVWSVIGGGLLGFFYVRCRRRFGSFACLIIVARHQRL